MTAFDDAASVLYADPQMSVSAVYRAQGRGAPQDVRVIAGVPDDIQQVFGQSVRVATVTVSVRVADVADVRAGDTFDIGDRRMVALEPRLDVEGVAWSVLCRNPIA